MNGLKVQHFAVSVSYDGALPANEEQWITTLADVFGQQTSSFDGYISSVRADLSRRIIDIRSYIVEDPVKFSPIKKNIQGDWLPFLSSKVSKAFEKRGLELQNAPVTVCCVPL